jgi:hypothetical protein
MGVIEHFKKEAYTQVQKYEMSKNENCVSKFNICQKGYKGK